MKQELKVKVIKRGQVIKSSPLAADESKVKRKAAREMVSTVSNWVSDLQSRKGEEAKMAFEKLFAVRPQTNEF